MGDKERAEEAERRHEHQGKVEDRYLPMCQLNLKATVEGTTLGG